MRLRLRDGDHSGRISVVCDSQICCNAAPSQGRRSHGNQSQLAWSQPLVLQCGSVSGTEITTASWNWSDQGIPGCNAAPSQGRRSLEARRAESRILGLAAMRLRLRDGDHACCLSASTIPSISLQCGSVSGTEITAPTAAPGCADGRGCNAAPSQGRRSRPPPMRPRERTSPLQCGSVSGTEITCTPVRPTTAGRSCCNAAPSQGRRSRPPPMRPRERTSPLQCGSVSGTEITCTPVRPTTAGRSCCNAAPSQGRRSRDRQQRKELAREVDAAMRLRLRDGDHPSPPHPADQTSTSCNAAPSQGRRSLANTLRSRLSSDSMLQCGSVSGTEITSAALH